MKIALSIAGSDSGAGAGIQADLKTFTNLGVYGCTAITAVTAQNSQDVSSVFEVTPECIAKQIRSVITDMQPDAIKIGMVYNKPNIEIIRRLLKGSKVPVVLDPILSAGTGGKLLLPEAFESFRTDLIPLSTIITPNRIEAQKITGIQIISQSDIANAARKIKDLGARNVIIKGCHLKKKRQVVDVLLTSEGRLVEISNSKLSSLEIHGAGCNFSAAVTAFLARNFSIVDAFKLANSYVRDSLENALKIGKGLLVSNPASIMYDYASRYVVLKGLHSAIAAIETTDNFGILIPETQSNIAFALPDARKLDHIAAIKGRIIKIDDAARSASSVVEFGASKHVGSALLAYMTVNRLSRSAMNIKYDENIRKITKSLFRVSNYDRSREPRHILRKEGMSIFWGIKYALANNPEAEIIYHKGAVGKEPMCIIFASNPAEVVNKIWIILKEYLTSRVRDFEGA
ncbi:MAG TPA: bifunctional hydroxymethylpyrimidine kinase/phosphomethylpyrimidine kinase [Candidatus Nitrosopolaris sp.]|nr:bifunctional hydroxymethylpyrimidine kinase/phosphomethylpyrimidine kinase [Candidatus Nitrosopolaris sp.]